MACINERVGARFQRASDVMIVEDFPRSVAGNTLWALSIRAS